MGKKCFSPLNICIFQFFFVILRANSVMYPFWNGKNINTKYKNDEKIMHVYGTLPNHSGHVRCRTVN